MSNTRRTAKHYSKKANEIYEATRNGRQLHSEYEKAFLTDDQEQALVKLLVSMVYGNSDTDRATRLSCDEKMADQENCHHWHLDLAQAKEELFHILEGNKPQYSGDYGVLGTMEITTGQVSALFSNMTRLDDLIGEHLNPVEIGNELYQIRHPSIGAGFAGPEPLLSTQTLLIGGFATALMLSCVYYGAYMFGGAVIQAAKNAGNMFTLFGKSTAQAKVADTETLEAGLNSLKSHKL